MNSDQKPIIEDVLSVKCHEKVTINEVIKMIRNSLQPQNKKCSCKVGYKYLIIDTQNMPQKFELAHITEQLQAIYGAEMKNNPDSSTALNNMDIVIFWVENNGLNSADLLKEQIGHQNIQLVEKPRTASHVKTIFLSDSTSATP